MGTGVKLTKDQRKVYDDTLLVEDNRGREVKFEGQEIEDLAEVTCPTCQGTRLNATARAVAFRRVPWQVGQVTSARSSISWPSNLTSRPRLSSTSRVSS